MVLGTCPIERPAVTSQHSVPTARFSATDFAWEQVQESGLRAFGAGGTGVAAKHWQRGMTIADGHFAPDDPRLATSLTNVGLVLRQRGESHQASRHFEDAHLVWDRAVCWVRLMRPPGRVDAGYDDAAITRFEELIAQGKAGTLAIESLAALPPWGLDGWLSVRPRRSSDLRKLLSAVFLIASRGR